MGINDLSVDNKDELNLFIELIQKFIVLKILAMDFESAVIFFYRYRCLLWRSISQR